MRTRQTLALVSTELNIADAEVIFSGDLYHATESEVVRIAEEQLGHHHTVMLLGHNPGFELALMHFCPDVEIPADGKLMTTACVAVIDFASGEEAQLRHLKRPDN
jgi:phosphohistidine phosphatase SixA